MKKIMILFLLAFMSTALLAQGSPFSIEKGNTKVKFGGFVRTVAFADFGGIVPHYDFRSALMDAPNTWHRDSRLSVDASATRLSFQAIQSVDGFGDIEFYIESDLRGASDVLRLRQAYISFKGLIAGQAWSFMTDLPANAPTIDVQGVNSRTFLRTPLIGYRTSIDDKTTFGIALEFPSIRATYSGMTDLRALHQRFPDIPVYLQYKGKGGHIKLTGMFRAMDYGVNSSETIETVLAAGAQLSGSLKATRDITLFSQMIYGKGMARYINDLALLNLDLVPDVAGNSLQTLPMYSASLGMRANFNSEWYCSANISTAGITNKRDYFSPGEYFRGNYFSASLFYTGIKNMTIAGEYIHGYRKNMNDTHGNANRLQLMFMYRW